jgi:hypothetical protein
MYPSTFAHLHSEYAPPFGESAAAKPRRAHPGVGARLASLLRVPGRRPQLAGAGAQPCD